MAQPIKQAESQARAAESWPETAKILLCRVLLWVIKLTSSMVNPTVFVNCVSAPCHKLCLTRASASASPTCKWSVSTFQSLFQEPPVWYSENTPLKRSHETWFLFLFPPVIIQVTLKESFELCEPRFPYWQHGGGRNVLDEAEGDPNPHQLQNPSYIHIWRTYVDLISTILI